MFSHLELPMNRYTFVLPSENQNALARSPSALMPTLTSSLYCNTVTQGHLVRSEFLQRSTRNFEIRRRVLRVKKMTKFKKKHTHISLFTCRSADALCFHAPVHAPVSLSLSLSLHLHLQKWFRSRSDPNGIQERMFHQLKNLCMR